MEAKQHDVFWQYGQQMGQKEDKKYLENNEDKNNNGSKSLG